MPSHADSREYWEATIEKWDGHRYGSRKSTMSLVHWLTRNSQQAIQHRKQVPLDHLTPHIAGKRIIEIGCGTAPLCGELMKRGARSYHGFDIAENAIRIARERVGDDQNITFTRSDILDIPPLDTDIVISIGITHWISEDRVNHMLKIGQGADFLHHFSEKRYNLKQILRYLQLKSINAPKHQLWYMELDRVRELMKQNGYSDFYSFNHIKLESIVFFSTLPFADNLIS